MDKDFSLVKQALKNIDKVYSLPTANSYIEFKSHRSAMEVMGMNWHRIGNRLYDAIEKVAKETGNVVILDEGDVVKVRSARKGSKSVIQTKSSRINNRKKIVSKSLDKYIAR